MVFKSIKNRLTFWFLIVALPPLLITGVVNYTQRVSAIEKRSFDKLIAIRDLKINEIDKWFTAKLNDLRTITQDTETRRLSSLFQEEKSMHGYPELVSSVRESLYRFIENYTDYQEIYIIDPGTGNITISTNRSIEGENRSGNPYLTEPLKTRDIYIKDIFYSKHLSMLSMTFSAPIFKGKSSEDDVVGILVLRVILDQSIYALLRDHSGLGDTGETLIIDKGLIALNQLRNAPKGPLQMKVNALPAKLAAQGETGIMEAKDYRGKKVLAAYAHIPAAGWGFVAKQDISEIKEPIKSMLTNLIVMILFSCVAVYIVVLFLSRSIAKPVLEMTDVSRRIQLGDMTARNKYFTADEFGFLSRSFNQMADSLVDQMEIQKTGAELTDLMIKAPTLLIFAETLILKLIEITGAQLGVFFLQNPKNNRMAPYYSVGAVTDRIPSFDIESCEGELGKVIATRAISYVRDIPEDTLFILKTASGTAIPQSMLTIPVLIRDNVTAIISLSGFNPFPENIQDLLKRSWVITLNTSFSNLMANEETKILAGELSYKNRELSDQAEELQKKNEELVQKRIQVEEANRMKSQFLSNMSHELRTPLNSVMALSRVLIMQSAHKLSHDETKYLEIIERNGKHLLELINDILDLSKVESGKMDLAITTFSMHQLLDTIVESLYPIATEKGIDLTVDCPEHISAIRSDRTRVYQILQNIIGNSVKFTEQGHITITCRIENDMISVAVADTGIGISQDQLSKIFEEFYQVDGSTSRKYQGTGLGLTIARKTTELLGGRIDLESMPGQGSVFTLNLPISWHMETPSMPEPDEIDILQENKPNKDIILVVDDDKKTAGIISGYLREEGYETIIATSGKEALELAKKKNIFAVTLDLIMPDMDGLELLQALKKNPTTEDVKVIIVTVSKDKATGFALGAVGFVPKPVDKEILLKEVYRAVNTAAKLKQDSLVMVVDDSDVDRTTILDVIEGDGMSVIPAKNGKECMDLLKEITPDLVILDLVMPESDGFQVLTWIKSHPLYKHLPVIIVTAKDLNKTDWAKLKDHVCVVMEKHRLSPDILISNIDKCIEEKMGERSSRHTQKDTPPIGRPPSLPKILVIEDHPDNMTAIQAVLNHDYTILEATSGEVGLKKVLTEEPDLVLLDISLPGMDGVTLIKKIRTIKRLENIPVVALTAQAMKGDRKKFIQAGCDDYISKPFDPANLRETVLSLLKRRGKTDGVHGNH